MAMKQLFLFSHQASEVYIQQAQLQVNDEVILMLPKEIDKRFWYHQFRLIFHHSIVEHFALECQSIGLKVTVAKQDSIQAIFTSLVNPHADVIVVRPIDYDVQELLSTTLKSLTINVTILDDDYFYLKPDEISSWFKGQSNWKMANFYSMIRQQFNILMTHNKPIGGKYSFDSANRKRAPKGYTSRTPLFFSPDDLTKRVIQSIEKIYPNNPKSTKEFNYAVTKSQAKQALNHFITYELSTFGLVQDAMLQGNPFLSHSLLSLYMNNGLLRPQEVVDAAVDAYHNGLATIENVEGFVRQIIGWREYIRGVYQESMPQYKTLNNLTNNEPLPDWYWNANTTMNCLHQTIQETIDNSYNHHIQRLMVLSNYANLIGVKPIELSNWFNSMYIDSHDWVVTPNVYGMGLYADGGIMSTKPYISSGNYISRMSNYCDECYFDPNIKEGEKACPFNQLYWSFIDRHEPTLSKNPRMSLMYQKKKAQ